MERLAFKMQLRKGFEEEYFKRHNEIWPLLIALLKNTGISDYTIYLDESTGELLAVMNSEDPEKLSSLAHHPLMKQWWKFMSDIMETNPDNSPTTFNLKKVFHLD